MLLPSNSITDEKINPKIRSTACGSRRPHWPENFSVRRILAMKRVVAALALLLSWSSVLVLPEPAGGQSAPAKSGEWDKVVEAAKKEGKVVASIPPSTELRKGMEIAFTRRYGIGVEFVPARGGAIIQRMVSEAKTGAQYFDLHIGGTESVVTGLLPENILEPVEPFLILPDVKDPKQWWGGHIYIDNAKRFIYNFVAYQTVSLWANPNEYRPAEFKSFDDLLNAKLQGRIGISDPRTSGIGYSEFYPFIKANLPVVPLAVPKEGLYVSGGYGHLTVFKNQPHPNASKVFINWLLGHDGQEVFARGLGVGTRRLDVETKWLKEFGVISGKDFLTLDQFYKLENQSEEKINKIREPAAAVARKLLGS